MAATTMNTTAGQTIAREKMIVYLNTGTSASPTWKAFGKRVEDSSIEYDWSDNSTQDILGDTYTTMKKPIMSESFEPYYLDSGDAALAQIWDLAVVQQDAQALASQDCLIVHHYGGAAASPFAERYTNCAIRPNSLGGEGGDNLNMPIDVTFGGTRTVGTAKVTNGVVTFTAAA